MIIARVVDFIKSWLYYPEMKRYLREKCNVCYQKAELSTHGGIAMRVS